ncbi:hypothetical protein BFN03_14455 [Rhodococcus sp. WMMA185]|uniref:DUF1707 SHOCT-like domain-containing protein n=1 Tax=Rhodococcus sp. WMMA185 TaxID=679318 RepID=UPI000878AF07|nr:DUF1707 domain-containing protein [Rhodococcus sp. WMMA185]AOW93442.1 hypothetical protein BFN03_14455 [Rhodococcus sp. WMMA185]
MSDIRHPQPPVPGGIRIGTVERERAATALTEHFAAGRLDTDEFDTRVRQAYLAKTVADLSVLFADLPSKPHFGEESPNVQRRSSRDPAPLRMLVFLLAVLAAVLWVVTVRVPPLVFLPIVWLVLARFYVGRGSCRTG